MPTYEYECEQCGKLFEEFQSITAEPLKTCRFEGCGGRVHRLLSGGAGFLFKGSGFYITDYRSPSYKEKAKAEAGGASSSNSAAASSPSTAAGASGASSGASTASPSK